MAEKNIELDSVEIAAAVFGNCDRNIPFGLIAQLVRALG